MPILTADPSKTIFTVNYDNGGQHSGHYMMPHTKYDIFEQSEDRVGAFRDFAREGRYALRSTLEYGDSNARGAVSQTYVGWFPDPDWDGATIPMIRTETRYVGFSFLIDPNGHADDQNGEVIFKISENNAPPAVTLSTRDGGLYLNYGAVGGVAGEQVLIEDYDKGVWYDIVIGMRPDITTNATLQVSLRAQGEAEYTTVLERMNTPNVYLRGEAQLHWGVMKPTWETAPTDTTVRTVWHDSLRVGTSFEGAIPQDHRTGTAKADSLNGTIHANPLFGLGGNDVLQGFAGQDWLNGGRGMDTASYVDAKGAVVASLVTPSLNTGDAAGDSYTSIEGLAGSAFGDALTGNAGANRLVGNAGNDTLAGGAGNDRHIGGTGADQFLFTRGGGKDVIVDFKEGIDDVVLSRSLVGATMTAKMVMSKFAERVGDDLILKIAGGTTIIIKDGVEDHFGARDLLFI